MRVSCAVVCFVLAVTLASAQLPPRLNIPGALLVGQARPAPFRQQRIHNDSPGPRLRRPPPNAIPVPVRPVVEEPEEAPSTPDSGFDDEVTKLGISALQSAVRQASAPEEEPQNRPIHFRPERPVPVLRQDVRERERERENLPPPQRQQQVQRQEQRENIPRPPPRQEPREELPVRQPQPVRHQARQQIPLQQPAPQPVRQPNRGNHPHPARQPSQYLDEEGGGGRNNGRTRKPPVQILRKYRTDNADGSITWGYENEDGTFKEETLGIDCITRGKYGYVDPDGVRRDYKYETGNKCDEPEEEELLPERPHVQPGPQPRKPQFRPAGGQF